MSLLTISATATVAEWAQLILAVATLVGVVFALIRGKETHGEVKEINSAVNGVAAGEPTLAENVKELAAKAPAIEQAVTDVAAKVEKQG